MKKSVLTKLRRNHLLLVGALDLHLVRLQDGDGLGGAAADDDLWHNSIFKIIFGSAQCAKVWNTEADFD